MRFWHYITVLFLFLLCAENSIAQSDIQTIYSLARQAKDNGEFAKAITYYEEIYDKTNNEGYYRELVELYPQVEDYRSAEKMIKKRLRNFPDRLHYQVDLGHIYEMQDDEKSAKKEYEDAIDEMSGNQNQARLLANQFNQYQLYSYTEQVYLAARKLNKNDQLFRFELANAYAQQGKSSEMIGEYLNVLGSNRGYIQSVQNIFQRILHPDPEGKQMEDLRTQLLKRIQNEPEKEVFAELLIWLYIQDKNFTGAYLQAQALDKRSNEKGKRLHSLAKLALSNKAYDAAEKSLNYVINLGDESPYYLSSKMLLVDVLKEKVTTTEKYAIENLEKLQSVYDKNISELGKSAYTLPLIRGKAELHAYYLNEVDTAIQILEDALNIDGLSEINRAEVKIDLADLLLLTNDIWEASLLYSQVEKAFKYDQIGETAKFKNAKVAFYTGDFNWAQAQLDVLKGSTSKLISNDAMHLSNLITDNIGLDSMPEPLEMYARADLAIFKQDYGQAEQILDSIPKYFPASSLKDEVLFAHFKIEKAKRSFEKAATYLRKLIAEYGEDILGDDALFQLAKLEEEYLGNKEKAMEHYKQLITTYPSSLHVVECRKRYRMLRGDNLESTEIPKEEEL